MFIEDLKLEIGTLKFARDIAWKFEFNCKKTKEGRIQAEAFSRVQKTLEHYIQELEKPENFKNVITITK